MSNADRWGDLASQLGVQPVETAPSEASKPTNPPVSAPFPPAKTTAAPRPAKPSTNWSRLAGDLGLAPEVIAAAAIPPPQQASAPVTLPPPLPHSVPQPPPERTIVREERAGRPARQSTPVADLESFVSETVVSIDAYQQVEEVPSGNQSSESGSSEDEDHSRRRRRRRGGRGRSRRGDRDEVRRPATSPSSERPSPVNPSADSDDEEIWPQEVSFIDEVSELELAEHGDMRKAEDSSERPKEEGRQPRRRRRRGRGRRDRKGETPQPSAQPSGTASDANEFDLDGGPRSRPRNDRPTEDRHDDDDDDSCEDGHELDKSHRTVPSWDEAIGIIVTANLEARANSPGSRPANRGRGRGRGRGGRRDGNR